MSWGWLKKILGKLTDLKGVLPLPKGVKDGLQKGRDAGLWDQDHGPKG